jgi:hypothetical protein
MRSLSILAVVCLSLAGRSHAADEPPPQGQLTVYTSFLTTADEKKLAGRPVMITVRSGKKAIKQSEVAGGEVKILSDILVGTYEVWAEGEGMETIIKRGIAVTDRGNTDLRFAMNVGKGARVIEYGPVGPPPVRLVELLERLEAALKKLESRR